MQLALERRDILSEHASSLAKLTANAVASDDVGGLRTAQYRSAGHGYLRTRGGGRRVAARLSEMIECHPSAPTGATF